VTVVKPYDIERSVENKTFDSPTFFSDLKLPWFFVGKLVGIEMPESSFGRLGEINDMSMIGVILINELINCPCTVLLQFTRKSRPKSGAAGVNLILLICKIQMLERELKSARRSGTLVTEPSVAPTQEKSLLSGYKLNRFSWLARQGKSFMESML
jgi:hypothetical protein